VNHEKIQDHRFFESWKSVMEFTKKTCEPCSHPTLRKLVNNQNKQPYRIVIKTHPKILKHELKKAMKDKGVIDNLPYNIKDIEFLDYKSRGMHVF